MKGDWGTNQSCTLASELLQKYHVAVDRASGDPDFVHLAEQSRSLCLDPARYAEKFYLKSLSVVRQDPFPKRIETFFEELRQRLVQHIEPPHLIAEGLQIGVSDLSLIEEMAADGAPSAVVDGLCSHLVDSALETARRLVLNLGTSLQTKQLESPIELDESKVQRLSGMTSQTQPKILGQTSFDPMEPVLIIATAGRGTRLRTTIPKALLPLAGKPLVSPIIESARQAGIGSVIAVLKYGWRFHPPVLGDRITYVVQDAALGTAHSFATALLLVKEHQSPVVLSYSDTPFLSAASFTSVLRPVQQGSASMSMLAVSSDSMPEFGHLVEIDGCVGSVRQPRSGETGGDRADGGLYALSVGDVLPALLNTRNANPRYEFVFTDVVSQLSQEGKIVKALTVGDAREVIGINRPADLLLARQLVQELLAASKFFQQFGGDSSDDLSSAALLARIRYYTERSQNSTGAIFDLKALEVTDP